ncbi:hypothetical protein EAX61_11885 [Dokdonia sinensis]|uniref:Uncharacterized protein n=1 Tax=Dokdonia sinensis TaxID=2479847 RepID=A0A3M0FXG9_9FLAO|nr:hypothetical protein [Dokdonia sinensis]RMB57440.1 hypothetical protein EAX61_11885 [Dokdonia sinensis]
MNSKYKILDKFKYLADLIYALLIFFILSNLIKTNTLPSFFEGSFKIKLFYSLHFLALVLISFLLSKSLKKRDSIIRKIYSKSKKLNIPNNVKLIIIIVFVGNFICVLLGKTVYPFSNVGMFSNRSYFDSDSKSKIIYRLKYYYFEENKPKILDVRKEGFYFLSDKLGLGYTHEYTFSTTFHNKGKKENFDYLLNSLVDAQIDTLWVGVQSVNFETRKVTFNPDICDAITLNTDERYYGKVYIPNYQIQKCYEL